VTRLRPIQRAVTGPGVAVLALIGVHR